MRAAWLRRSSPNFGAKFFPGAVALRTSNSAKCPGSFLRETRKSQKEATYAGGYDSEIHAPVWSGHRFFIFGRFVEKGGPRAAYSCRTRAHCAAHGDAVRVSGAD